MHLSSPLDVPAQKHVPFGVAPRPRGKKFLQRQWLTADARRRVGATRQPIHVTSIL